MNKALKIFIYSFSFFVIFFAAVFGYFFVGSVVISDNIKWGVDFSQMQAESLGLNWKIMYLDLINDLKIKNIKIHTQWDWVEGIQGDYYFDDIDWQLKQASDNGVNIIYVLGMKSGRWPECHIPNWANSLSEQKQKDATLKYIREVVNRYKDNDAIIYWQIENEPFFYFGECPDWYYDSKELLNQEVALVKSIDNSRKIIVSDTGENSLWFGVAKIGDIVGTTMYRGVWLHITDKIGFGIKYLYPPIYYARKALLIDKIFKKSVICIELQAEPWVSRPFHDVPVEEQLKTMNNKILRDNINYAKNTGLDTFYFWGAEWWYWMKTTQNNSTLWDEIKGLIN